MAEHFHALKVAEIVPETSEANSIRFEIPADLREAHERNDEVLERIYIGRRFRNDTERLEKLFELYTKMAASPGAAKKRKVEART